MCGRWAGLSCVVRATTAFEHVRSYSGNLPAVSKTVGGAVATANPLGVVVAGAMANTTIASGEACDVVVFGPVAGYSSMTSGATIWVSDTAGRLSSVVGTKSGTTLQPRGYSS